MCWALAKAGDEYPRIAEKLKISADEVESAIREFEAKRALASSDIVDMITNTEAMRAIEGSGEDIRNARQAVRFTGAYDANGDPVFDRDWSTALDAIDRAINMATSTKPKGGGVNVAVGIQNSPGGNGIGQVKTFEQRVREKRGILGDGDVKFLSDGQGNEIVDGNVDDNEELGDELADGTSETEIEEADEQRD